ncbi:hypothetical protein WME97_45555 [Sorangium sp. So ce367]|uniref:hypothetical protein n=1 Tax=Sorangium sp. So ce367 TaxID=3133305 RepID=UPI003F612AAA
MKTTLLAVDGTLLVIGCSVKSPWLEAIKYTLVFAQAAARAETKPEWGPSSGFMMSEKSYIGSLVRHLQKTGWILTDEVATMGLDAQTFAENRRDASLASKLLDRAPSGFPAAGYRTPSMVLRRALAVAAPAEGGPSTLQFWWSRAHDMNMSNYVNVGIGAVSASRDPRHPITLSFSIVSFDPSAVQYHLESDDTQPSTWRYLLAGGIAHIPTTHYFTLSTQLNWAAYASVANSLKSRLSDKLGEHVDTMVLRS